MLALTSRQGMQVKPQWATASRLSGRVLRILSEKDPKVRTRRTGDPRALLVGTWTGAATVEGSVEGPQKTKNRSAL